MCGIFGYIGARDEAPQVVLAGLKKLEYRGYDSWGIAARQNGSAAGAGLLVEKHVGKIGQATTTLPGGQAALGHTRWATHGGVTETNAHPHLDCTGRFAVIHNGIIENHEELRRELMARGHRFSSETDTEVVSHLLEDGARDVADCEGLVEALIRVFRRLDGLSAISVLDPGAQCIAAAKNGSPLVLGWGEDGNYLASDSSALLEHTRRLTFLEDGQAALVSGEQVAVYEVASGRQLSDVKVWDITWHEELADLEGHPHYMDKEIHEQPRVLRRLAAEALDEAQVLARMVAEASTVHLVGCGSAAHAAKAGEYLFSRVAAQQANAVVGSEFGYLTDFVNERSLVIGFSQSGETIDLLESMKAGRQHGAKLAALVNVEGSSLFRMVDCPLLLRAGPERCVLATKSFTAKIAVLLLAAYAARGRLAEGQRVVERAADEIQLFLSDGRVEQVRALAERIVEREHLYVIGRGPSYPLALEAALKIKEVSYMHAEGFAGGELKHGVIALIEDGTPCLVLAPNDETFRAIVSGAQEIKARGGYIVGISPRASDVWDMHIPVGDVGEGAALVNAVPPQVLAYHLALLRGLDPDKPRNLAKSVTVK
ncbi:MAG TPA: glutamine--fructose-6-phosphate transaminase (isomerizing) [Chloroflexota bacterium]|nr:glutamine--fructose-6-phosphate transaminase (isomerizing) [Chloroflexota bacterium]